MFASQYGQYLIKFLLHQRFRLQSWLAYFPSLPALVKYREQKMTKKWNKLDSFVQSWKLAFENFKEETGLLFVHLNKSDHLNQNITSYDKLAL